MISDVQTSGSASDQSFTSGSFSSLLARHQLLLIACMLLTALMAMGLHVTRASPVPYFAIHTDTKAKKQAFFDYMQVHAQAVNGRVMADRARLLKLREQVQREPLSWLDRWYVGRMTESYLAEDAEFDSEAEHLDELLLRVDRVPRSLLLIQAAKESGWGSSRFARQGYNFFGQHCFEPGCGFTPRNRDAGRRHEVARFDSAEDAVRAYVHNLNTHPKYQEFRQLRSAIRKSEQPLSGTALAAGLLSYSERGQAYIDEIKRMIRRNGLE